jgi:D-cysteine desulfhydrase
VTGPPDGPTTARAFPLFNRFPELEAALPRVPLSAGPSPVAPLAELGKRLGGGGIWIKNDGYYGWLYGGNKPRKLELVLADAAASGAHTILTTGALGTNHGLATALYGAHMGFEVVLLLTYEHPDDTTARQLCWMHRAGARLHFTRSIPQTVLMTPLFLYRYRWGNPPRSPYALAPGASTPLGTLGYVNAALELAEQVMAGELPEPETIVVPLGSAGTAAGIMLGLRIAGMQTRVIGVAVTRAPTVWRVSVARLANAAGRLLVRRGAGAVPTVRRADIDVVRAWLGPGYGKPSEKGRKAIATLAETEGLVLDPVYTAKTMSALIDLRGSGALQGPVLYWHTYNAVAEPPEFTRDDYLKLPKQFHPFCPLS